MLLQESQEPINPLSNAFERRRLDFLPSRPMLSGEPADR